MTESVSAYEWELAFRSESVSGSELRRTSESESRWECGLQLGKPSEFGLRSE